MCHIFPAESKEKTWSIFWQRLLWRLMAGRRYFPYRISWRISTARGKLSDSFCELFSLNLATKVPKIVLTPSRISERFSPDCWSISTSTPSPKPSPMKRKKLALNQLGCYSCSLIIIYLCAHRMVNSFVLEGTTITRRNFWNLRKLWGKAPFNTFWIEKQNKIRVSVRKK